MLFYSTRAILPFILGNTGDIAREEGNPLAFAVQTAFYLVAFSFIARQWRTVLRGAWNAKWILLLAFVALISTVWSQHRLLTLRRSAVMLGTTAFGINFEAALQFPSSCVWWVAPALLSYSRASSWRYSFRTMASITIGALVLGGVHLRIRIHSQGPWSSRYWCFTSRDRRLTGGCAGWESLGHCAYWCSPTRPQASWYLQ